MAFYGKWDFIVQDFGLLDAGNWTWAISLLDAAGSLCKSDEDFPTTVGLEQGAVGLEVFCFSDRVVANHSYAKCLFACYN